MLSTTSKLFWINFEENYFVCRKNSPDKNVKIFELSKICDGKKDCFDGTDEFSDGLKFLNVFENGLEKCETPK